MSEISAEAVPNQYIVVFKDNISEKVCQEHCEWAQSAHTEACAARAESDEEGLELTGVGEQFNIQTMSGYVGSFDESVKKDIEARAEVDFVEPDYIATTCTNVTQRPVPSWGLGRISSNCRLTDPPPADLGYTYDSTAGEGTYGYVIDTGILTTHEDFDGRATWGFNAVPGSSDTDKAGHGTHVAGTVGGTKYGIAKKCNLIAVKVLGDTGRGPTSGVIKGVEWAVTDAAEKGRLRKAALNMSLTSPKSEALNRAAALAVEAGLTVVAAAGNYNRDAAFYSPASEPLAITVASIAITDTKAANSNWGTCVDLFGPGVSITSDWCTPGNAGTRTISGTSMATPHISGLALTLIAKDPAAHNSPAAVKAAIIGLANQNSRVLPPVPQGTTTLLGFNGL